MITGIQSSSLSKHSRPASDVDSVSDEQEGKASSAAPWMPASIAAPAAVAPADAPGQRELQRAMNDATRASNAQQALAKLVLDGARPADIANAQAMAEVADAALKRSLDVLSSVAPAGGDAEKSYADFWDEVAGAIGGLKRDYLGVYETAMQKNNAFYEDFTTFMSNAAKWTVGDTDITLTLEETTWRDPTSEEVDMYMEEIARNSWGGVPVGEYAWLPGSFRSLSQQKKRDFISTDPKFKTKIEGGYIAALKSLLKKYAPASADSIKNGVLVTVDSEAKASKWAKDMGLPEGSVQQNPADSSQWWVKVNLEPVTNMINALEDLREKKPDVKTITLTPARHGAWKSGFEAQQESLKTNASTLGQKMAGAQSIYENLIKVLTGTIASMLESAKSFLQN